MVKRKEEIMAKIYNLKTSEYTLPPSAYYRTVYLIKDYPRLCQEAEAVMLATPPQTETSEIQRQRSIRAAETQAIKYASIMSDVRIIEDALEVIPDDAQAAILKNILYAEPYPIDRDKRTYGRYKQKYIYTVAQKKGIVT